MVAPGVVRNKAARIDCRKKAPNAAVLHEMRQQALTGFTGGGSPSARYRLDQHLDLAVLGAGDRNAAADRHANFGDGAVAGASHARDAAKGDDVAAMDANEMSSIQALFDRADRQAAEIFPFAVVNVSIVGIGAHGEYLVGRNVAKAPVFLDPNEARASILRRRPGVERRCGLIERGDAGARLGRRNRISRFGDEFSGAIRHEGKQEGAGHAKSNQRRQQRQSVSRQR